MQALILQTFRFLGSIFFEPIMRTMLYLIARCSHFKAIEIGNWSFWGPPSFLKLAEEAAEYLKAEGSEILGGAPPKFDVMYGWSEFRRSSSMAKRIHFGCVYCLGCAGNINGVGVHLFHLRLQTEDSLAVGNRPAFHPVG